MDEFHYGVTPIETWLKTDLMKSSRLGQGTAFFYDCKEVHYLITNKHMVYTEDPPRYPNTFKIKIHTNRDVVREVRDVEIPLYDENKEPLWLEHPHLIDVDIIALDMTEHLKGSDVIFRWTKDDFPSQSQVNLGSVVSIIGYPLGFYDSLHNLPIARFGTIASPYEVGFEGEPFFLVDSTLHHGISGSPVIIPRAGIHHRRSRARPTPLHTLLGVISAREHDPNTGINLELGRVWYPLLIEEIINQ